MKRKMKNLFSNKSLFPKKDTAKDSKRTLLQDKQTILQILQAITKGPTQLGHEKREAHMHSPY